MSRTFFFYDLETSGVNPREARIMQFAGIRTDMQLNPIGEPYNILVKLSDDILPDPAAIMVTGITPQSTQADGLSEAEFARLLIDEVFVEDTITVGFNNVQFDDEFIRHLFWRTFQDPYEWAWRDGRSRWDLLDVVRMTRALRPEGIEWPVNEKGDSSNRLEHLSAANGLKHEHAHDALSDVEVLIDVARLIRDKQPQLFDYLLKMRDKKEVMSLINLDNKQPFVHTTIGYSKEHERTSVAFPLTQGRNGAVVIYDLREDPTPFIDMSAKDISASIFANWETRQKDGYVRVPVRELAYNKAPAVAPLGVLASHGGWEKVGLSEEIIQKHRDILLKHPAFAENVRSAIESREPFPPGKMAEAKLYDGFVPDQDKIRMQAVREADVTALADMHPQFIDERLSELLLRYKARNYPKALADDEMRAWEQWRSEYIQTQLPRFMSELQRIAHEKQDDQTQFLLQELQLWAESIMPSDFDESS